MGLFDRLKKAFAEKDGLIGEAPSEAFPTQIGLIRAAIEEHTAVTNGGERWLTLEAPAEGGKRGGIIQLSDDRLNLCDRDDVDVAGILRDAGQADLAGRVRVVDNAMVTIENVSKDELALVIDLLFVGGLHASEGYRLRAKIEG